MLKKFAQNPVGILLGILLVVLAVFLVVFFSSFPQASRLRQSRYSSQTEQSAITSETANRDKVEKQTNEAPLLTLKGEVVEINIPDGYLILQEQSSREKFKVRIGEKIRIVRLVRSPTIKGNSFTYEERKGAIGDLKIGNEAIVSSLRPIKRGEDIVNPYQVKILP